MSLTVKVEVNPGLNNPKWMIIRFVIFFGALFTTLHVDTCVSIFFFDTDTI